MNRFNPLGRSDRSNFGAYGFLPKDCWTLLGNRCNITTKLKIAYTCTTLKQHYFRQYAKLEKWHNRLDPIKESSYAINEILYDAAKGGHRDLVDSVRRDLVDFFISKGADNWDWCLRYAAKGGHRDLIDFFISKGANDWDWGLQGAASCKDSTVRRDLVDFFISKGATEWNRALESAAKGGHRDLVDFFVKKGANQWHFGLESAAKGGHRDLIDFFIEKVGDSSNMGLHGAVQCKDATVRRDLVDFFILKYNECGTVIYWDDAIEIAEIYGHHDLVNYLALRRRCGSAEAQ